MEKNPFSVLIMIEKSTLATPSLLSDLVSIWSFFCKKKRTLFSDCKAGTLFFTFFRTDIVLLFFFFLV